MLLPIDCDVMRVCLDIFDGLGEILVVCNGVSLFLGVCVKFYVNRRYRNCSKSFI